MKAIYLKHTRKPSKYGGFFYYIFCKGEDGKSYRTCIGDNFRNFFKWKNILHHAESGDELLNLQTKLFKGKKIIDADSSPTLKKIEHNETDIFPTR
ncbi:MAG: hypothetical protein GOVbin7581_7 [Prokaryotic dsDNA virus sp.]|mgnify:CR=1 FL=1|nr:MAG: hypothetical protein GOVbin7581_7 [Prokaryotic dsDNA virus sp.]|tara:strand:+ start:2887 stop:3174 length:288 start_codon:yes stop_codon:yes gene_type:complete